MYVGSGSDTDGPQTAKFETFACLSKLSIKRIATRRSPDPLPPLSRRHRLILTANSPPADVSTSAVQIAVLRSSQKIKAAPTSVACAYRTRYPSEPNRQGEHVSIANTLLGIVLCLMLSACSAPPKTPTTDERTVRQTRGELEKPAGITEAPTATTPPGSRCTSQLKQGYALR